MDTKTLTALEASIKHWEEMLLQEEPNFQYAHRPGVEGCALCRLFINNNCKGCPVLESTGNAFCNNSPYFEAFCTWNDWASTYCSPEDRNGTPEQARSVWREAAQAELAFLKSLLPKDSSDDPSV